MSAPAGRVSVAFDAGMWVADPVWTALDQQHPSLITSWSCDRGRAYELDRTQGGRATVEIIDRHGVLDPTNFSGPYAGKLQPLKQIMLCRWHPMGGGWQSRFRGWIEDIDVVIDPSQRVNRIVISCIDLFEILGAIEMQAGQFGDPLPPDLEGPLIFFEDATIFARVTQILGNAGPPPAGIPPEFYVVFSGNVRLSDSRYSVGESPLTAIVEAVESDWPGSAMAYVDRHGRLNCHGRFARWDPAAVIAGGGEALRWDYHEFRVGDYAAVTASPGNVAQLREFAFNRGVSKVINHATAYPQWMWDEPNNRWRPIEAAEIEGQLVSNAASIDQHGYRSWSSQNLQTWYGLADGADALTETRRMAQAMVDNMATPRDRITRVGFRSIRPGRVGSAVTWDLLCKVDVSDQLEITVDSAGGGGFFAEQYYVEGVHESSRRLNNTHDDDTVTLDLSPRSYFATDPWNPP